MNFKISAESHGKKVGGVFDSLHIAQTAKQALIDEGHFAERDVNVISPEDSNWQQQVEPEARGIGRTLWHSHLKIGLAGLVVGIIIALLLVSLGPAMATESPFFTFFSVVVITGFLSLLLAGAVAIRPDHDLLIQKVRHALKTQHWAVVVHAHTQEEKLCAKELLQRYTARLAETL